MSSVLPYLRKLKNLAVRNKTSKKMCKEMQTEYAFESGLILFSKSLGFQDFVDNANQTAAMFNREEDVDDEVFKNNIVFKNRIKINLSYSWQR